jgi:hypothetical protein
VLSVGPFGNALTFALVALLADIAGDASLRLAFGISELLILVTCGPLYLLWRKVDRVPPSVEPASITRDEGSPP